jgi:hypothetical protein
MSVQCQTQLADHVGPERVTSYCRHCSVTQRQTYLIRELSFAGTTALSLRFGIRGVANQEFLT